MTLMTRNCFFCFTSPSSNERHCCSHDSLVMKLRNQEQVRCVSAFTSKFSVSSHLMKNIDVQRQTGKVGHSMPSVANIHDGLWAHGAISLKNTARLVVRHGALCIANIQLCACDVVGSSIERRRLGQARDGVLRECVGRRQGPRCHRRNRAIVDDATTHGYL